MTTEDGLNLAGVELVMQMEKRLEQMRSEVSRMRARAEAMERKMVEEVESMRRSLRAEIVPYGAYEPGLGKEAEAEKSVKIPVERKRRKR
jgi:hypothetical protein